MCLLVTREVNSTWQPSSEEQFNAWSSNPHGFGAAWISRKGVLLYQKTMKQKDVAGIIKSIPKGSPCLLHWRMATHGVRNLANCHPWPCFGNNWVGAHYGVLRRQPLVDGLTDSESYLRGLDGTEPNIKQIEEDVDALGYGKLAFLSNKGEIRIAHEEDGSWRIKGEVWQSNGAMDSVPWHSWDHFGSYNNLPRLAREMLCEGCETHAPLYRAGRDMLCQSCVEVF